MSEQPCFCLSEEAVAFYRYCHGSDSCCNADEGLPCFDVKEEDDEPADS